MKKIILTTLLAGMFISAVAVQVQAAPYYYLDTGLFTETGSAAVNASAEFSAYPSSGMVGFSYWNGPMQTVQVYHLDGSGVTDLGNPIGSGKIGVRGGITDDMAVTAQWGSSYSWFYNPGTATWGQSSSYKHRVDDVNQTHASGGDGQPWIYDLVGAGGQSAPGNTGSPPWPPECWQSYLNNNGDIAAKKAFAFGTYVWDNTTTTWDLTEEPLDVSGGINDSRIIAGRNAANQAVLYDYNTASVIHTIPFVGDRNYAELKDINNAGTVIGFQDGNAGKMWFVWDAVNGVRDLNSPAVVDNLPAGDYIKEVTELSEEGVIVGRSNNSFLVVLIPEPATIGLLLLGGLALLRRRR